MHRNSLLHALAALVLVGCAVEGPATETGTHRVRVLTGIYNKVSRDLGRPPKDEQEFKDKVNSAGLSPKSLKVSSIEELFVSERDGQPFAIVYGSTPKGSDVVVYEQTGVDGKRLVGHRIGMVEEVDEAKFQELVAPAAASQ
jgi:hypothetical protein